MSPARGQGAVPVVGLLHTSSAHTATFDRLLDEGAHGAVAAVHRVEPDLLVAARRDPADPRVADGVRAALASLTGSGADAVLVTCSTLGPLAERVGAGPAPVLRVDRPMARAAVARGPRIGVVVALASTLDATTDLLRDEAARAGRRVDLDVRLAEGAWAAWEAGEPASYDAQVAAAARALAPEVDVVVLAQASMLGALALLDDLGDRVLASPIVAVADVVSRLR